MSTLNAAQSKILTFAPKPLAVVSFFCTLYTVIDICRCPVRRHKVYHRLVLAMMSVTSLNCICAFIGTWAMPADMGIYQAFGTRSTCTVQGSYIFFGIICTIIYYSNLSIFSYIAVNLDFKEERLRKFEPWLHAPPWIISISWTAIGTSKDYMNPAGPWCLPSPSMTPEGYPLSSVSCVEKNCTDHAFQNYIKISFVIFILSFFTCLIMVIFIYQAHTKKTRINFKKYAGKKIIMEKYRKEKAKQVVKQSLFYLLSFFTCVLISTLSRIIQSNSNAKLHFPTLVLGVLASSAQGLVLFIVYNRTRLRKFQTEENIDHIAQRSYSITSIADIEKNIMDKESRAPTPTKRSLDKINFSIFDGTCPSSTYAQFVHSSDESSTVEPKEYLGETSYEAVARNNNGSSPVETVDDALLPVSLSESTQERNFPDNEESKTEETAI